LDELASCQLLKSSFCLCRCWRRSIAPKIPARTGASLAISVAAYGPEQSVDHDDVMVDDHPQRMHRHRF
jgi:hypothetical protein